MDRRSKQTFLQEAHEKDAQHHYYKNADTSEMAIIKKSTTITAGEAVGKREPLRCQWECKLIQPLWGTVWRFCKILKIELPHDPAIPLLGIYFSVPSQIGGKIKELTCTSLMYLGLPEEKNLFILTCQRKVVWLRSQAGKAAERQTLLIKLEQKCCLFLQKQNTLNTQRKLEKEKQTWRNQVP